MDPFESIKAAQKAGWVYFAPLEMSNTPAAARLVRHASVKPGQRVLDVACGTGIAAITAARTGAHVTGLDFTPELLERARENGRIANVAVEWHEGDVEGLPFGDGAFDVVLSQFGHIFAPRAGLALNEMLRVLKAGGTLAFSTWPPELLVARWFELFARFGPPPVAGASPPPQWGDPGIVRQRLGTMVEDVVFERATMLVPALSPENLRASNEGTLGPMKAIVASLEKDDPKKLAAFRAAFDALTAEHFHENLVSQGYLMTRATKVAI